MPTELELERYAQDIKLNKPDEWNPTEEQKARVKFVYDERDEMKNKRDLTYVQFNDRTLLEYIDDSEKRLNAYVLDKATQGKEDWQANFATRAYANKAKALLAAAARDIPDMKFDAVDGGGQFNFIAADVIKNLTRHSYQQKNVQEELFFLSWSLVGKGTVLSYEGVQQCAFKEKRITAFDLLTGDVDYEEVENKSYGEPVSFEIPLQDLYIKNFYIRDIQDQPAIIWETYYADRDTFDYEWGKYPNAKFVKDLATIQPQENDTYFVQKYKQQAKDGRGIVLSRLLNKYRDLYRVVANGVELYNGPMLWKDITRQGWKVYPIAKEIFEPFANTNFFYGNSMPNSAMGEGDVLNTLINSGLDKNYRGMVPPLLIGMVNKDMLDLEDEVVAGDTKIYVDDINQVKQLDIKGISDSDVKMIDLISRGFDLTTLDPQQQGVAEKYVTARAAVAADERARQLKGLFFMFLEGLWLQKVKLRIPNILYSYTKPQLLRKLDEEGREVIEQIFRTYNVENAELSDGTRGTLAVQFAPDRETLRGMQPEIEVEEEMNRMEGKPFEKIAVVYSFLDQFSYIAQIVPQSLWSTSQALMIALTVEEINTMAAIFPEYFEENKPEFFKKFLRAYGDSLENYRLPQTQSFEEKQALALAAGGKVEGGGQSGNSQLISDISGVDRNNRLSKLTGVEQ